MAAPGRRALDGIDPRRTTAAYICFGYAAIIHERPTGYSFLTGALAPKHIMVGCLDLSDPIVETPAVVRARIERALAHVPADRIILAPDCGMKYLPREIAEGKLRAMVAAAHELRAAHS